MRQKTQLFAGLAAWVAALSAFPPSGHAQPGPATAGQTSALDARADSSELVLRVDGPFSDSGLAALERVLRAQLGAPESGVRLVRTDEPLLSWTRRTRSERRALVIAILDARAPESWELYVVDAERGRAVRRSLPGGVETDAATLEAVGVILAAAVAAVREGVEVASEPVEDVVSEAEPPPQTAPAPGPVAPRPERAAATRAPRWSLGAGLLGTRLAERLNAGAVVAVGAHFGAASLRLEAAGFLPLAIESELGSFELQRWSFASRIAWNLAAGAITLAPNFGPALEVVSREDPEPRLLVAGTSGNAHTRFGATGGLALAYPLWPSLSGVLGFEASYFPRELRFVAAAPRPRTLAELSTLEFAIRIGIEWVPGS